MPAVLPGAEPFSAPGGASGVLVLHGFTGNPQSVRPLAQAFAASGFTVELPLLPGHGTTVEDLAGTGWGDWSSAAEHALTVLQKRCERVVVAGLSMGGALTAWLATRHAELSGVVLVNPAALPMPAEMVQQLSGLVGQGVEFIPGVGSDIAAEGVTELAYDRVPVRAALSLNTGLEELVPDLAKIACPVLLITSAQDHVVPPASGDLVADSVSGQVERVVLSRSFHVATLDLDAAELEQAAVAFAQRVTAGA